MKRMGRKRKRHHQSKRPPPATPSQSKTQAEKGAPRASAAQGARSVAAEPASSRLGNGIWAALLVLLLLFVIVIKSFALNPYPGDEYIYLYQSKLVGDGATPYRDFAMAHPPVQALLTSVLLEIFGTGLMTLRLIPLVWFLIGGVLLALLARRELGDAAGLLAPLFYLLSHEPLRASSHFTGVNMTVTLLIAMILLLRTKKLKAAALLAVMAVFTRLYAIPAVAVATLFLLVANRRQGLELIKWGALFGGAAVILFGLWAGFGDMVHNLLLYHAQKTPMNPASLSDMKLKVLFHNATIAILFGLSLLTLLFELNRHFAKAGQQGIPSPLRHAVTASRTGMVILSFAIASTMLLVLINMDRVWMYYFIPSFPFAAICAAWMASRLLNGGIAWVMAKRRPERPAPDKRALFLGAAAVVLFGLGFAASPMLEHGLIYYEKEMKKPPEARVHAYTFHPGPLPDIINRWVKANFWEETRTIGDRYNVLNFYLWHESRVFDIVDDVVDTILAETEPGDEIFGDSGTVPMFALLSGRRIAANEVDTNIQRYRSGNADPGALLSKIDNDKTKMIILRHRFGVSGVAEVRHLVKTKYRRLKRLRSAQGFVFDIFKRKTVKESAS